MTDTPSPAARAEALAYMPIGLPREVRSHPYRIEIDAPIYLRLPMALFAPHEAQARKNHSQSLRRLAERGGLSACEAVAILEGRGWHGMSEQAAYARLHQLAALDAQARLIEEAREVIVAYAQWEADVIIDGRCWRGALPTIPQDLWDRLIGLQAKRNAFLATLPAKAGDRI